MPLTKIICDDPIDGGGEYALEACLHCALTGGPRRCQAPYSLIKAMTSNAVERRDAGISATMILGCPRKVILQEEVDYAEKPSAYWARFRGVLGHLMMEEYGPDEHPHIVQEVRRRKTYNVDGYEVALTGKPDWLDVERNLLVDFKSVKSINTKPIKEGVPKEGHEEQLNIYIDLCWGGVNMDTGQQEWVDITTAGLAYFDMSGIIKVGARVWTPEEREAFIVERMRPIVEYKRTGILPPFMRNDKGYRHILCNYCPVREACDARGEAA